ncbi:septum formation initiator family protein [Citrifermentans bemidjiense Bem]|uniref:Septum formation initiator family protein n=1 Tax=Citrifermentans bemidjiense (strain ATCC BAA-1014 / DSM 16622 / JCM 12645 / Bem) TaxID=404380 RepID=B5EEF2_CITBB|nr:septum formation initiator family protein [Citrifermentans bemidjiense]ACH39297.1 septum formation initiator family protein [Citrifermentans bemidjiense Bem]
MQKRLFFVPLAVIIFILYFTVFGDRGLLRINHLHRDLDDTQKRLSELKEENDQLKREIAALQSDRRYLESIARRDFGLVRSNEVVYQFPPQARSAAPQAPEPAAATRQTAPPAAAAKNPPAGGPRSRQ